MKRDAMGLKHDIVNRSKKIMKEKQMKMKEREDLSKRQIKWKYWAIEYISWEASSCIANWHNFQESIYLLLNYIYVKLKHFLKKCNFEPYCLSDPTQKFSTGFSFKNKWIWLNFTFTIILQDEKVCLIMSHNLSYINF